MDLNDDRTARIARRAILAAAAVLLVGAGALAERYAGPYSPERVSVTVTARLEPRPIQRWSAALSHSRSRAGPCWG